MRSLARAAHAALDVVLAYRLRSFFIVLGTMVGVTFMVAVVTIITGMDAYMREDLARRLLGLNTVVLSAGPTPADAGHGRPVPPLTLADAGWLRAHLRAPGVLTAQAEGSMRVLGPRGAALANVRVIAASASYFRAVSAAILQGRAFTGMEAAAGNRVLVVGSAVADELFPGRSAVGGAVRVGGARYRVIGVLAPQGEVLGFSLDRVAIAPARAPIGALLAGAGRTGEIVFAAAEPEGVPAARAEIEGLMRARHHLPPRARDDFQLRTSAGALALIGRITTIMLVLVPSLVGISMLVGGVVITNIMLVSVAQRTREVGVLRSVGARRRDVLLQFLLEATALSGIGGALGFGGGALLALTASALSPLPARVAPWSVGAALLLALTVGLAAGVYPAYRASSLDPADALRRE